MKQERKQPAAPRAAARPPVGSSPRAPDISGALRRVLTLCDRPPPAGLPKRLDALFRELQREKPPRGAEETGDLIWALWTDHTEPAAVDAMHAAIGQIVAKESDRARFLGVARDPLLQEVPQDLPLPAASRLLGYLRVVIIGTTFGAGPELDAFFSHYGVVVSAVLDQ